MGMMKMLIGRLAKEQFYELIFLMRMVHRGTASPKIFLIICCSTGYGPVGGQGRGKRAVCERVDGLVDLARLLTIKIPERRQKF